MYRWRGIWRSKKNLSKLKWRFYHWKKYKIKLSVKTKNDCKSIIRYIKYKLLEPTIAEKYVKLIRNELNSLEYKPQKFAVIDYDIRTRIV